MPKTNPYHHSAADDLAHAKLDKKNQLTDSLSYRLAYDDLSFMLTDELRPVRLQLEFMKPEIALSRENINATLVVFGSARIKEPEESRQSLEQAQSILAKTPNCSEAIQNLKTAERQVKMSEYYQYAEKFAFKVATESSKVIENGLHIVTGGGGGIMEAANKGAARAGKSTVGLNIVLPREQQPNPYITPELSFQFHYFAIRKMHFLLRAHALAAFPGGYGTLDELFETLTLIQTKKIKKIPIILFGKEYWKSLVDFNQLVDEGMIAPEDLQLIHFSDSASDAWSYLQKKLKR